MADRRVKVGLELESSNFEAGAKRAKKAVEDIASATKKVSEGSGAASGGMSRLSESVRRNSDDLQQVGGALAGVGAGLTAATVGMGKATMDWESAWAGVTKTVNGTDQEMAALEGSLRDLAKTLPSTHQEIAAVAESAGQLGVAREDVAGFTKTMIDLGETTNLTAEEAGTNIAQISNVMGTMEREGAKGVERFGAALVALGNDGASTEAEILDMAQRIAGAGATVGATEADVLALSNTLASMGVKAELGGGVTTRVILKMRTAVDEGGQSLESFAKVAGVSADEFSAKFKSAPVEAMDLVAKGIYQVNEAGGNVTETLKSMGIKGTEETQVMLALANSGTLLADSLKLGEEAWKSNTALVAEAEKRYATAESRIKVAWNQIKDAAIDAGGAILPVVADLAEAAGGLIGAFTGLPGPIKGGVGALAAVGGVAATAAGGFLMLAPRAVETYDAFKRLSAASPKTAGALGKVGKAAGVASAALVGFEVLKGIANDAVPAAAGLEAVANAMLKVDESGDFSALDDLFDKNDDVRSFGDALKYLDPRDLDSHMESFGETVLGLRTSSAQAREQMVELDQVLSSMAPEDAAAQFQRLREEAERSGSSQLSSWEGLKATLPEYAAAVEEASNATGKSADAATLYGIAMGHLPQHMIDAKNAATDAAAGIGELGEATSDVTADLGALGQIDADSKVGGIAEAMGVLADESTEAGDKLDGMLDALTRMGIVESNAITATMSYQEALSDLADTAAENAATLDLSTEAGRNNMGALQGLADAGRELFDANVRAGESQGTLRDGLVDTYDTLVANAEAMGESSTEADALARKLMGIPTSVDVETYLSDQALLMANQTGEAIEAIPGYKGVAIAVTEDGTTGTVQSKINEIDGTTAYVWVTDDGTKETVQQEIREINGQEVPVWVTDEGTIVGTQEAIYALTGKDVDVTAVPYTSTAEEALNWTARSRTSTVYARYDPASWNSPPPNNYVMRRSSGGGVPGLAGGGVARLPGYSSGGILPRTGLGADMILGVTSSGMPIARVDDGEMIVRRSSTDKYRKALALINDDHPSVRHLRGYATGGIPGREWAAQSVAPVVNVAAAEPLDVAGIAQAVASAARAGAASARVDLYVDQRRFAAAQRQSQRFTEGR